MYEIKYRSPDEMKDSRIQWLGKVPKDWEIKRLKYIADCSPSNVDKKSKPSEKLVKLCNYTDVYYNDYINKNIKFMDATATKTQINKFELKVGDIVLTKDSESPDDIGIASYVSETVNNLVCGYHLTLVKTNKQFNSLYLYFQLSSKGIRNYFETVANGVTRYGLGIDSFKNVSLCLSAEHDQHKIANFLDIKTAQFDSIISKKELLMKKLEEAKKSLISEVVTGKLKIVDGEMVPRQSEEMKDSGIEWLGMIPKDWQIRKIKRLSIIGRGASPRPIDDPRYFDDTGEYAWTRIADVTTSGKFLLHTKQTTSKLGANLSVKLEPQDLFISIAGSVGKPCITKIKACIHDGFVYFPKLDNKYVEFLYYIFYIGQCYKGLGKLGTQLNLNRETIGNIDIALPLTDTEINSIIKYIVYKEGRIEYLTATIASEIEKLKQAKQSLISEAVTGKIDLRDWEIIEEGGVQ